MPPALRRSASSPSVRAAPYPTSSPIHPNPSNPATSPAIVGRPRRGGSDASGRRVLADIEWWRVMQGQQGDDYEHEHEHEHERERERENAPAADQEGDDLQRDARTNNIAPMRPRTPEPISPLYTVSEDAHMGTPAALPDSGNESIPSSAESTPSRPRTYHSLSFPSLTFAALRLEDDDVLR